MICVIFLFIVVEVDTAGFDDDWNDSGKAENVENAISIDSSTIPLTTNAAGEKIFRFFWWDAYEDPYKQPGNIYMFGKGKLFLKYVFD